MDTGGEGGNSSPLLNSNWPYSLDQPLFFLLCRLIQVRYISVTGLVTMADIMVPCSVACIMNHILFFIFIFLAFIHSYLYAILYFFYIYIVIVWRFFPVMYIFHDVRTP